MDFLVLVLNIQGKWLEKFWVKLKFLVASLIRTENLFEVINFVDGIVMETWLAKIFFMFASSYVDLLLTSVFRELSLTDSTIPDISDSFCCLFYLWIYHTPNFWLLTVLFNLRMVAWPFFWHFLSERTLKCLRNFWSSLANDWECVLWSNSCIGRIDAHNNIFNFMIRVDNAVGFFYWHLQKVICKRIIIIQTN